MHRIFIIRALLIRNSNFAGREYHLLKLELTQKTRESSRVFIIGMNGQGDGVVVTLITEPCTFE